MDAVKDLGGTYPELHLERRKMEKLIFNEDVQDPIRYPRHPS